MATDIGDLCSIEWEDPIDAIERCYELGWTDGLPVVPPTQERVQQFLDYVGRSAEEVIGSVRERRRQVTVGKTGGQCGYGRRPARGPSACRSRVRLSSYSHLV